MTAEPSRKVQSLRGSVCLDQSYLPFIGWLGVLDVQLVGAEFLVLCDLLARLLSGQRVVHLGVITAFLGVPFFLWLLARSKRVQ